MSSREPRRLAAVVATVVLGLTLVVATPPAQGQGLAPSEPESQGSLATSPTRARFDLPPSVENKIGTGVVKRVVQEDGPVRVIVTTRLPNAEVTTAESRRGLTMLQTSVAEARSDLVANEPDGVTVERTYDYIPAMAVSVTGKEALERLARRTDVAHVALDDPAQLFHSESIPLIGADNRHATGNEGDGVRVAVVDTGVDSDHPDLVDDILATDQACFGDTDGLINGVGFCPNGSDRQFGAGAAEDDEGHGTHVAGTVTSNGTESAVGVAPGAEIIGIKAFDANGSSGFSSDLVAAYDWLIANHATLQTDVLNMSYGGNLAYVGNCDAENPALFTAMDTLRSLGVAPVAAAGNSGKAAMSTPACLSNVIAVGASTDTDDPALFTDSNTITDLFAPGVNVSSAAFGGGTELRSGTSMATPHVAGCAALLVDNGEGGTVDDVEARLESSTVLIERNGQVFPRLDCDITSTAICSPDDSLEGNDSRAFATTIGPVQNFPAISCDDDYYEFDVDAGATIDLDVLFTHADGNLQVQLIDPAGTVVVAATSATDNESVTHVAASSGPYIARVFGAGSATNHYIFQLDARPGVCPPDDGFEPNNTTATATPLAYPGTVDGIVCDSNADIFAVTLGLGETIDVELLFPTGAGDLDLEIYDTALNFITASISATDNEKASITTATSGTFYIVVYGLSNPAVGYTLSVTPGTPGCTDDGFEPNNTLAAAAPLPSSATFSGVICSDDDYYSFPVTAGDELIISMTLNHFEGDLDIELHGPSGLLDVSDGAFNTQSIVHTATTTGTYVVRVYPSATDQNGYQLDVVGVEVCNGMAITVDIGAGQVPTNGNDVILGTSGGDIINAMDGDDSVCALGGADTVVGADGNDVVLGGPGNDLISGNSDNDLLFGGPGRDRAFGGSGDDVVRGGPGNDLSLGGSSGSDTVLGEAGNDGLTGGSDSDPLVDGGPGDDAVNGGGGPDTNVHGGPGNDSVSGNGGNDEIDGDDGDDTVRGGPGDDTVRGGPGDDFVSGNDGNDVCDGGADVLGDSAASNCETVLNVP